MDAAIRQARIERFFYHIVAELPKCILNYVTRMNKSAVIAGFSFDTITHGENEELVSDKTHVIIASDKVGALINKVVTSSEEKLVRIWEIVNE